MNIPRSLLEALAAGEPAGRYHNGWMLCGFCDAQVEGEHSLDCPYIELTNMLGEYSMSEFE